MSRYLVKAMNPKHRVTVGFDRAAGTTGAGYFAQVEDIEIECELEKLIESEKYDPNLNEKIDDLESKVVILWVGHDYQNPINSVDELEEIIKHYVIIDQATKAQLQEDAQVESEQQSNMMKNFIQTFLDNQKS